jgi:hypothetical protein
MCQACVAADRNWIFSNGSERKGFYLHKLYQNFSESLPEVRLCRSCSIDLFLLVELRFFSQNPEFLESIVGQAFDRSGS